MNRPRSHRPTGWSDCHCKRGILGQFCPAAEKLVRADLVYLEFSGRRSSAGYGSEAPETLDRAEVKHEQRRRYVRKKGAR